MRQANHIAVYQSFNFRHALVLLSSSFATSEVVSELSITMTLMAELHLFSSSAGVSPDPFQPILSYGTFKSSSRGAKHFMAATNNTLF